MTTRAHNVIVNAVVAVLIASVAAPGLTLHNCKQFGTRSTQLCSCCEVVLESSDGCCSQKPIPSLTFSDATQEVTPKLESSCCFTSIEGPFSFSAQGSLQSTMSTPSQHELAIVLPASSNQNVITFDLGFVHSDLSTRHSSDPPSYILTHSFRC